MAHANVRAGFSLVEVVFAIGIFAAAIVAVLGLLPSSTRSVGDVLDSETASRLTQNIQAELNRIGFSTAASLPSEIQLFGTLDGGRVLVKSDADNDPEAGTPQGIANRDRYFLITLSQLAGAFEFQPTRSGTISYRAVVQWPYLGQSTETHQERRQTYFFALNR